YRGHCVARCPFHRPQGDQRFGRCSRGFEQMENADRMIMRNRADNPYRLDDTPAHGTSGRAFDRQPALRIILLFGIILASMLTIAARMMHVQGQLSDRYAAEFDRTSERFEAIPSHDGRILAAGGEVLAEDREVFALSVHYRWLEDPADARWLRGMALSRLDR